MNMAMALDTNTSHIKAFPVASDPLTVGSRWKRWKRGFEYFVAARGVTKADQKKALLLDMAGEEVQDIFDVLPNGEGDDSYKKAMSAIDSHFQAKTNTTYERSVFRRTEIRKDETVVNYITRLRQLALTCEYTDVEIEIRDQIIEKLPFSRLRRKLLEQGSDLTLTKIVSIAQTEEAINQQNTERGSEVKQEEVNKVLNSRARQFMRNTTARPEAMRNTVCYRCKATDHIASSDSCPARGRSCNVCHKKGHFGGARFCKGVQSNRNISATAAVSDAAKDDVATLFAVSDLLDNEGTTDDGMFNIAPTKSARIVVRINNIASSVLVDSGASSNLMDKATAKTLKCQIRPTNKQLFAYGNKSRCIDLIGETDVNVVVPDNGKCVHATFYIFNGTATTLLGRHTSERLDVLRVGPTKGEVNVASSGSAPGDLDPWLSRFPECFAGVGRLKDVQVALHIDSGVRPVAQPVRRMPFGHRLKAKAKLDELLASDIIERVEGPTPWVSPIVTVPKDGNDIRLCVDMRQANKAIIRERHPIPTIKELLYNLNGARFFSKIDLKLGYHQLELDEASRVITTFVTPFGVFRYKRLNFGVASGSELYQYQIQKAISGLAGCQNYADDIVVFGSSREEHDTRLREFFKHMS